MLMTRLSPSPFLSVSATWPEATSMKMSRVSLQLTHAYQATCVTAGQREVRIVTKTNVISFHSTALYCTLMYCTVLYCTVLYCTVLYCTVLYCAAHCQKSRQCQGGQDDKWHFTTAPVPTQSFCTLRATSFIGHLECAL